jgi:16S rRNA (uracil1498-N3)-methyltransferase
MSGFLTSESLSNAELYYAPPTAFSGATVEISGEEFHHIVKVMRHEAGQTLLVTDGAGSVFTCGIKDIGKNSLTAEIRERKKFSNNWSKKVFCIPRLKSPERFEFALEKAVELGVTKFIIFESRRTIAKGAKTERWNKITLAAMKQSLRCYLPEIEYMKSLSQILKLPGIKLAFEQNSGKRLNEMTFEQDVEYYFIFGPEGGLDENELALFNGEDLYELGANRLRTETAVLKAASIVSDL